MMNFPMRMATNRYYNTEIHYCMCPSCQNKFPVPRKLNKRRKKEHHKDIWCPFCKKVVTMIEKY